MQRDAQYSNRELDRMFLGVHEKLDSIIDQNNILDTKVTYTNGKVRKIIIALVAVAFFCLGLGITQVSILLPLISAL